MDVNQILRHGLELCMLIPAAFFCLLPMRQQLRIKPGIVYWVAAWTIAVFIVGGAFFCSVHPGFSPYILYASFLVFFPFLLWASDMHWVKILFCFLNAAMLCSLSSLYTNFIMAPWELDTEPTFSPLSSLICIDIAVVIGAIMFRTLYVKLPYLFTQARLDRIWKWLAIGSAIMVVLLRWAIPSDMFILTLGRIRYVALSFLLIISVMLWLLYQMFWWLTVRLIRGSRLMQENSLLQMEAKRYRELRYHINSTRTLRHDFRQHLHVITELARSGQTEKLVEYLGSVESAELNPPERYCENIAVDAIAAFYARYAASRDVDVKWTLALPAELPVDESDFCGMLGNLLDNAVTAVSSLPEKDRRITVASRMLSESMMGLSVENPYTGILKLDTRGRPISNRDDHGIGLASVTATVHKYHGSIDIRTEDNIFAVSILLYPDQKND